MRSAMSCLTLSASGLFPVIQLNYCSDFAFTETIEADCRHEGSSDPRRLELRAVCDDKQHSKCSQPFHCATRTYLKITDWDRSAINVE